MTLGYFYNPRRDPSLTLGLCGACPTHSLSTQSGSVASPGTLQLSDCSAPSPASHLLEEWSLALLEWKPDLLAWPEYYPPVGVKALK